MSAGAPALLFGLGATKAGNTWLSRYLAGHPQVHMRSVPEVHFFDTVATGNVEDRITELKRYRRQAERQFDRGDLEEAELHRRLSDLNELIALTRAGNEHGYLAYLNAWRGDARVVADVTPAYALLDDGVLVRMQALGPGTRFIYLMRDPVARLWSNVRMVAARGVEASGDVAARCGAILNQVEKGARANILDRGAYGATLDKLARLDPARVLVEFYETLFRSETVARICGFLGLDPHPADFATRVHEGVAVPVTDATRDRLWQLTKHEYGAVRQRIGTLPHAWEATAGVA